MTMMTMSTSSLKAGKKLICFSILVLMTLMIIKFPQKYQSDKYDTQDFVNIISNISVVSPETKYPDSRLHKFENLEKIMEEIALKIENMKPKYVPRFSIFDTKAPFLPDQKFREFTPVSDDTYFDKMQAVTNADLVAIYANQSKLLAAINDKYFLHCSNDMKTVDKHEPTAFLNRSCDHQASSLLPNVGFHPGVLSVSMPGDKTWMSQERYLLTHLHIFRDAAVAPTGDIYLHHIVNTKLVPWRCTPRGESFPTSRLQSRHVYDEVFTISLSWGNAFYHALIEDFSRLIPFLSFLKRNKQVKVHVYRPNSFMTSLLEMVGIPRERLISGVAEARVLYQPAGSRCGFGTFFPLQALSMISTKDFALAALPRDTVVLIKRSKLRWFDYHDDILQMLKNITTKYLTNVVVYDDKALPSLQDTIALFYRTFMIVAPHGAGLSNMVYSRPGTFILEGLCCGETVNLCYQTLADLLGHRHYGVFKPGGCFDVLPEDIQPVAEFALEAFCHPDEQVPF